MNKISFYVVIGIVVVIFLAAFLQNLNFFDGAPLPDSGVVGGDTQLPSNLPEEADLDDVLNRVRLLAADAFGLDSQGFINVVNVEEVDWPNSCLGIETTEVACAQVITPGYRIIVEDSSGRTAVYHTDLTGGTIAKNNSL